MPHVVAPKDHGRDRTRLSMATLPASYPLKKKLCDKTMEFLFKTAFSGIYSKKEAVFQIERNCELKKLCVCELKLTFQHHCSDLINIQKFQGIETLI